MAVEACMVSLLMRRGLEIREAFSPTRLSSEYLRAVYEAVSPVIERLVVTSLDKELVVDDGVLREVLPERKRTR